MLRVFSGRTYKPIPTTHLQRVKSTNISSVGSRWRAWRRTVTTHWRKKTPLCVSKASKTGMASRSSWLACRMFWLPESGNYTLSRIWNGMIMTNDQSNTGVETSSKGWDGWCGSQRVASIGFTPLSLALTARRHRHVSIPKFKLQTGGGRHWQGGIPEYDDVLTKVKSTLRVGDTVVPLMFIFDGTHLSNFATDKKEWPVYMTIGNLSSKLHRMPSMHSVVKVALLPIPIKNRNIPQKLLDEQRQTNREVLNDVLLRVLHHLNFKQNPSAESGYCKVLCADSNFRPCKRFLAAWLADCPRYSDLHHLERHVCFWCECPKNRYGDYIPPDKQHPRRDHNLYRTLSDFNTMAADAKLSSRHVHRGFNLFWHSPHIVNNLPKPVLLYSMQIGIHDDLQKWIVHFMKTHEWLNMCYAIWLSVPA